MNQPLTLPQRPALPDPATLAARIAAAQGRLMAAERAKLARQRQFIQ